MTVSSETKDILNNVISEDTNMARDSTRSLEIIDTQVKELQEKQDAIQHGVCDVAADDIQDKVEELCPLPLYIFYEDPSFNKVLDSTGSVTDWKVMIKIMDNTDSTEQYHHFIVSRYNEIKSRGDVRYLFHEDAINADIAFTKYAVDSTEYTTIQYMRIAEILYDTTSMYTYVTTDSYIDSSSCVCFTPKYYYIDFIWDEKIVKSVSSWNHGHQYINQPIGPGGTYGTKDKIASMKKSKELVQSNQTFMQETKNKFRDYL